MELKPGLSALITGGATGIGKALSLALAGKGIFVTVVDFSEEKGKEVASLVEKENSRFHENLQFPSSIFVKCDVTNPGEITSAFEKHVATYGGLDICINNAGVGSPVLFTEDQTDGTKTWRRTINVNLVAVIDCTRLAIKTMQALQKPGVIINMGSSSGLYPMYMDPIYSGSKGGAVLFTRSLTPYKRQGIRVNVLCPEFVRTEMGEKVDSKLISLMGGYAPMEMVVKGAFELIADESRAGSCLWITNRRGLQYWPSLTEEAKYSVRYSSSSRNNKISFQAPLTSQLPQNFKKLVVHTLSHHFRDATYVIRAPLKLLLESDQVLLKVIYAGVNAGDVNYSAGRYFKGNKKDLGSLLPFDAGFEAVGIIAAIGDSVRNLKVGTPAAIMGFGCYAEFMKVPSNHILPIPRPVPEVVTLLTSGLTASIALEEVGQMKSGKVVLVTAAAGGTGQFAVQLAKLAGNQVVATCGGNEKAMLLKELGVDRVIDYKTEDVKTALKEFPKGVDIVYECVGGNMFDLCLNALAIRGRLIAIGMISQYQGKQGWIPLNYPGLVEKLLAKSQAVAGFVLVQYSHFWKEHLIRLFHLYSSGKLKVVIDPKRFSGLDSVADAVEHLHSGKSTGKVVVCVDPSFEHQIAKL
ncbi:ARP protein (REF) isoform 2 [Hibiscus syriacus]|uniref:ARP protein (REF) isoform 2 n=1 Tax=Hibiscus syriacus TaxID=106335 RepID=A0A6A2Y5D5_HIBSY|nr:probable quinone oxidoreductase isoform X2 [Hibiscus syriacus]KAE8667869.1 ARP protein (REF) isoform 2 [Hibiscus syriacus]